jgi:hypothetical protein
MKNKIFIVFVFLSLYSCRNYESEKYIAIENEAINDILLQLTNYECIKNNDYFDTNHLKLFVFSSLDTTWIYDFYVPDFTEYYGGIDANKLTDSEIKQFEELCEKFKEERKLFKPLKNGKLKKRTLDYTFEHSNIEIEFIDSISCWEIKQNELGYLGISRILFNKRFDKGYLSYDLFCEDGSHGGNIEIVKINGKWKINRHFSGWVA